MKNLNLHVTLLVQKGVGTPFPPHYTPEYTPTCQHQILDKSSAQHEIRCFFIYQYSAVSKNFFSTYCTVFLTVAFRTKKIEWMRIWSLTYCKLHVFRCDVEKYCLMIFNVLVMQWTPSRAKCQHNYCFRVFWYVCPYTYPKRFFGVREAVLVFEIIYFFGLPVIFYGQMTSIINSILF